MGLPRRSSTNSLWATTTLRLFFGGGSCLRTDLHDFLFSGIVVGTLMSAIVGGSNFSDPAVVHGSSADM